VYDEQDAVLGRSIEHLDVSTYTLNKLRLGGICSLGDLVSRTPRGLLQIDRFGPDCLRQVEEALAEWGLGLSKTNYLDLR
jgi:DNA-directed RNA polymerase alpha subunit